ncbi:voltage-gated ion channel superfamily [Nannochloropsis gaditana]|uniref:Voltage-gated ion channel superfamily n=1 Tax=Nannochloropsis gaditana TaxID=72520 RepID=W7T2S1_9STRA|nr:voltage-gated ion channel superfamily [Nannochloropsis gaditana]
MTRRLARALTRLNNLFVLIFCLEAYIKVRGWGWPLYKKLGSPALDFLVVVISLLEVFLGGTSARSYALRCVRLLRLFSLGRKWKSFRLVLTNVLYTAANSLPFLLLTTTFLSVFAIGGMTFLGGKLRDTDPSTGLPVPARANFDSFYWAVISIFQIMTLDDWNLHMYRAMGAADAALAAGFYVTAVLLGRPWIRRLPASTATPPSPPSCADSSSSPASSSPSTPPDLRGEDLRLSSAFSFASGRASFSPSSSSNRCIARSVWAVSGPTRTPT